MVRKYAKILDEKTKLCTVGIGTDKKFYQSMGMSIMDVEQGWNGDWYLMGFAPQKPEVPEPTTEEKVQALELSTGLTRAVRELVLADNSGVSDYVRAKAQEIESLANPLRGGPAESAQAETQKEEGQ